MFAAVLEKSPGVFREGEKIASVYGVFLPSMWNGARLTAGVFMSS